MCNMFVMTYAHLGLKVTSQRPARSGLDLCLSFFDGCMVGACGCESAAGERESVVWRAAVCDLHALLK